MADTFDSVVADVKVLTQQQIAETAKAQNAAIVGDMPHPLNVVRHVDGVLGAAESTVKPDGVIVYDYGRLDQVADFALDTVRQLSPVDSGDYVRSHVLMLNGQVVVDFSTWKPGDRITISNPLAYVRKIEIGKKGYRAHAHVYEKAEQIVSRRFGNVARVIFDFERAPDGAIFDWAKKSSMSHREHASTASREQWLTNQPTLVITELG